MNFTNLKGIVFDLDFTLYDESDYFMAVFKEFAGRVGKTLDTTGMRSWFYGARLQSKDIFSDFIRMYLPLADAGSAHEELFKIYCSLETQLKPYEDVLPVLDYFKKKDMKFGLLTNGLMEAQRNKVRSLQIESYFYGIVYARQCGQDKEKPNEASFERICESLKLEAYQLAFVGDNPDTDFEGAKKIGGRTVRVCRGINKNKPKTSSIDWEVQSLSDLTLL